MPKFSTKENGQFSKYWLEHQQNNAFIRNFIKHNSSYAQILEYDDYLYCEDAEIPHAVPACSSQYGNIERHSIIILIFCILSIGERENLMFFM